MRKSWRKLTDSMKNVQILPSKCDENLLKVFGKNVISVKQCTHESEI
jgi:hypothetical protein